MSQRSLLRGWPVVLVLAGSCPGFAADGVGTGDERRPLRAEILDADARLFGAFNRREIEPMAKLFSPRLEFFHDITGLSGHAQTIAALASNFARPAQVRRELIADSVEVFPVPGLGAMQFGRHRFCSRPSTADPESCQLLRFAHVWERSEQGWQLLRVLSVDH